MTAKNVVVAKAVLLTIAGATVETASLATVSLLVIVATAVLIAMAKVRAVSTVTAARVATVMTVAPSEAAKVAAEGKNVLGYASHSLALGKPDRHMDPFRIEFPADGVDSESSHEGEELIICIAGQVELTYGCEKTILGPGDTAYYNSVVKHGLKAVGGKPASIYGIVFMPF